MDTNRMSAEKTQSLGEFGVPASRSPCRSTIPFVAWLQVAANTASLVSSMNRGRKGQRYYGVLSDLRDAYRITNRPDPKEAGDILEALRAAFPGGRFDERYRRSVGTALQSFRHDCELIDRFSRKASEKQLAN